MSAGPRDYPPGERVPGTVYQVIRRIGSGGMGTVYDVEDTTIGKRYVLKALHPQLGNREDLARRMQNEGRTLARLHHPNIVEVITAGVTSDDLRLPYYVMERLSGQSLRLVLEKKGQLELAHAYHIAIDLLDALDHAHDKGVIHRDVKPDNIFLHRTNAGVTVTKLLDFGIVSLLDSGPRETAGHFVGTLRYAAPEQLRGEDPTPKMDLYCAGLVLYEMVAGRGPFDEQGSSHQIAEAHLHRPAPPISRFVVVPRELEGLLTSALSKMPDARPRDAFSFAASLRNLKRALSPEGALDSTESRATAPAVVSPASGAAPFVDVRRSAADGQYIVSPAPAAEPLSYTESVPRTTVRGMVAPTMGPPLASASAVRITATTPEAVDRRAATHSLVARSPTPAQGGTEAVGVPVNLGFTVRAHPLPMQEGVAPIRWPPEVPLALSEGPQVRTLTPTPPPAASRAALVMAISAMLGLAAVAGLLLIVRQKLSLRPVSAVTAPSAVLSAAPLPEPRPVAAAPAPTPATPPLDDSAAPGAPGASASPAASAPSTPPRPAAKPRPTASIRPTPPAPPAPEPDRPGPGF